MDIGTISTRYARALFSLALDKGQETRLYDDMKMLFASFTSEQELKAALNNPIVSDTDKMRLLTSAAGIEVSELFTRFIGLVLQHRREGLLPLITLIYIHMYRKEKKIIRVEFDTAVPIDLATQTHLEQKLTQTTGSSIEFSGILKPELLGGFVLRIGNERLDASYASQLRKIRSRLLTETI